MNEPVRAVELAAATLVPVPIRTKTVVRLLALGLAALGTVLALAPWQQSVSGQGRVIAYAPVERRQSVDAPLSGRIMRWFVQEGATVVPGQELVEISDNDPLFSERLQTERAAVASKLANYEEQVIALEAQIANATRSRRTETIAAEAKLRVATEKLRSLELKVEAADAALVTATLNLGRTRALADRGLAAERDLEFATLNATKARTDREGAQADVHAALGEIDAARATIEKVRADGDAKIQDAEVKLRSGRSEVADARASLTRLEVTIARQANQIVRAPRAAVVLQVLAAQGGEQVKQGDPLAMLVPVTEDRAVEVWIDGNDAAIVSEQRHVRLQFEGWPAVQFVGWPSVAVGTFGGVVAFVDSHDDGHGNFRVVLVPDPKSEPWPSARFLRQGVRTKAWILLEQVSLGFELWRRFNGFPPMLEKDVEVGVSFSMPLWMRKANGKLQAAAAKLEAAQKKLDFAQDKLIAEVRDAWSQHRAAQERSQLASASAAAAEQVAQGERDRFDLGATTVLFVNLREQAATDARLAYIDAVAELQYSAARLVTLTGQSLSE